MLAEGDGIAPRRLACTGGQHLFRHHHQRFVIGVRLVELEHRELGIVLRRDALVAEVAVDFVDPFEAADDETLEIELRRNAQEELHVERVMVRHERTRERAAGDRLHHRRLDFEIAAPVQKRANRREDLAAHLERPPRIGIDDQIEVALAVPDLDITETVPLFREGNKALDQELQRGGEDRQFVRLRPEQLATDADEITEVEELEDGEVPLRQRVLADIDLDPRSAVRDHQEVCLPETADCQDPPRGRRFYRRRLQCLGCGVAISGDEFIDVVSAIERPWDKDRRRGARAPRNSRGAGAADRIRGLLRSCGCDSACTHDASGRRIDSAGTVDRARGPIPASALFAPNPALR